jgi:polyphosphate kinase
MSAEATDEVLHGGPAAATDDGPGDPELDPGAHASFDVEPPYVSADADLPADRFLDRELSWLAFNERVLELAEDETLPLLERVRFVSIFARNLDEFFMVRVAGLKRRIVAGVAVSTLAGRTPRETIREILGRSRELMQRTAHLFRDDLVPALQEVGIGLLRWEDLTEDEQAVARETFERRIFPVLTPLAVDPAHPFPYISGLSLNLAVAVRNPDSGRTHFARVKIPPIFTRWMPVGEERFVALEDVVGAHLDLLFPGMEIVAHHAFRVTRNEDLEVEEDDAENLLKALEKELLRRRFGPPVRLEVEETITPHVLELLVSEMDVLPAEVMRLPGPLDLGGLSAIADLDRSELKFPPFVPVTHPDLASVETASPADLFSAVAEHDVLLHHPYDSFATSVQRFVEQAANDPHVLAIKQTLYRTSGDSPIIDALIDAAESGKQVLVLVELKARFDEQANIRWARKLEQAGCHVVYGLLGLKTHCKLALVVRDEPEGLRRYTHIGTGNYNPRTARQYEDLGLLTANEQVAADVTDLFNNLSGYSRPSEYQRLLVAPAGVREGLLAVIQREVEHHRAGRPAHIRIKVNSLVDEATIDALLHASREGVPVDLLTRGICGLRPGVAGMSESVRVRSVLGRFLEHSRIFHVENGGEPEAWIGSADLMHRNLDRRVETLVRIPSPTHVRELGDLLRLAFDEGTAAWHLQPDGRWRRRHLDGEGKPLLDLQDAMMAAARQRRGRKGRDKG